MHHPRPVFDEAFLEQIAAQLSKQRDELDRLRRAVKAASRARPTEKYDWSWIFGRRTWSAIDHRFGSCRPHKKEVG
jgi:hypothetical protein